MKIYFSILIFMAAFTAAAQEPRVIIYSAPEEASASSSKEEIHQVKLNLLAPLGGNIAVSLERQLLSKLTAEASAGVTLRNFGQNFLYDFFEVQNDFNYGIIRTHGIGPSVSAAIKYYPDGALEGYYFSPEIRYRRYNSSAWETGIGAPYDEYNTLTDFKLQFGYVSYIDQHIVMEYFAGVGIRYRNSEMLQFVEEDPVTKSPVYGVRLQSSSEYAPLLSIGLKFGFSF